MSRNTRDAGPATGYPGTTVREPVAASRPAVPAAPGGRADRFLEMSAFLTGYGRGRLAGTGLTDAYLRTIDAALPAGVLDELLDTFGRLPDGGAEACGVPAILDDLRLGPVARNVILLWYCGTWTALSEAWHAAYGAAPLDITHVVKAV